jgi:hypothetical protein
MDIMVEIRVYANDQVISSLLVDYIYTTFPPRCFIRVPQKDGTFRSWDMTFESYHDMDKREAVRSGTPGVQREYAKVFTYKVEGYFDNTDTARIVNVVRSSKINFRVPSDAPAITTSVPSTWASGKDYSAGQTVISFSGYPGHVFECIIAGTSNPEREPSWPTSLGSRIADGTVTWQVI